MGGQGVALTKMAVAERMVPPSPELFKPGRRAGRGILGAPRWSVNIFQELFRPGCTCAVAPRMYPLGAAVSTIARYIAWHGQGKSMQTYMSDINDFYRDHGVEHVAWGEISIAKTRKGLAAS
eukprot:jgi/Tetstr1/447909/TSEL_035217.t1